MKRAAIFAHYDENNIIRDYCIYYLRALKSVCDKVIFVSCRELSDTEKQKLNSIADYVISEFHKEYDFGSYKRGFKYLLENKILDDTDELIFVNDSCYGPFYPLENIFTAMEKENIDFWGMTKNNFGYKKYIFEIFAKRPHIQSYFLVFNKNVFTSKVFKEFMLSVCEQTEKRQVIINYEIGLSEKLVSAGFKYDVWVKGYENINNPAVLKWRDIIVKNHMPFMKKSLIKLKNNGSVTIAGYEDVISTLGYPLSLMEMPRPVNNFVPASVKWFIYGNLVNFPYIFRKPFTLLINKVFKFVKD